MNRKQLDGLLNLRIIDWKIDIDSIGRESLHLFFDDGKSIIFGGIDNLVQLAILDKED